MSASFVCSSRGSAGQRHLSSGFLLLFSPFHPVTLQLPLKSGTPLWQNLTIETLKKSSKCSHESSPPTAPGMSSLSTRGPSLHPSGPRRWLNLILSTFFGVLRPFWFFVILWGWLNLFSGYMFLFVPSLAKFISEIVAELIRSIFSSII